MNCYNNIGQDHENHLITILQCTGAQHITY
jgi:hypothetical protein